MDKILSCSLTEIVELLKNKKVTSREVVSACLNQIKATENINALISYNEEYALKMADISDKRISEGNARTLEGVPVVVKDNISTTDYKTTCASEFLKDYISPFDASVVNKLKEAGAVIIGKANMDEFAMGSSGENSAFGKTLNPINNEYVTGGSSSGSVSAVRANLCYASLGTDTGGSIRQPSGFCGVVGIKPTYGRVSRYGVVAFGSSLDQVGPVTKTVKDNAIMLSIISGKDKNDFTSEDVEVPNFHKSFKDSIKGMRIGVAKEFFNLPMNADVKGAIEKTIEFYKNNGAEIVDISLPNIDKALAVYYIISSAEVASNLSRFDGIKYTTRAKEYDGLIDLYYKSRSQGFGSEVKRRILMGNYVLSASYYDAYYRKASKVRQMLIKEFNNAFESVDAIISPTSPTPAFKFGEMATPLDMYLADIFTVPINIVGVPAISFPVGVGGKDKMPIGCQLIANKWQEDVLYTLAEFYEKNAGGKN